MASHTTAHDPDHPTVGHVVSYRILYGTAAVLLFLTVVTVAVRAVDLGEMNVVVALLIAAVKASLVALYFMHLRWDKPFNGVAFLSSILFVALFMGFALLDSHAYWTSIDEGLAPGASTVIEAEVSRPFDDAPGAVGAAGAADAAGANGAENAPAPE